MEIIDNGTYREIVASKGRYLKKGNLYFAKGIMLPGETEANYGEVDEIPVIIDESEYKNRVEELIRGRYSISDEIGVLRQKNEKPEEYTAYYEFVEQCKIKAKN